MSPYPADDLRTLEGKPEAAWLWDAGRHRMVWANRAGLAFWGEDSLLDLIERSFEPGGEAVRRIGDLADALTAGEWRRETFVFHPRGAETVVDALCRTKTLDDGRTGVLVVRAGDAADDGADARSGLAGAVIDALPVPIAVFDQHASLVFANAACRDLVAGIRDTGAGVLTDWLGDEDRARELIDLGIGLGSASEAEPMETRFGRRVHRITVRRIKAPVHGRDALLFMFEDIEDRRRIERARERRLAAIEAYVEAAADFTFALDDRLRLRDVSPGAAGLFDADPAGLIGRDWGAACAGLGLEVDTATAVAIAGLEPVRGAVVGIGRGGGRRYAVLSAIPAGEGDGRAAGMRGALTLLAGNATTPNEPASAEPPAGAGDGEAAPVPPGRSRADDEATFSAIARAIAAHSDEPPEAREGTTAGTDRDPASGGLRVVGGVDHGTAAKEPAPSVRSIGHADLAGLGEPALVHRAFAVLGANDEAVALLAGGGPATPLKGANLLNLFPDERARLFTLQGQFDDGAVLEPGEVGLIPLRPAGARAAEPLLVRLERVLFDGEPALLMRFEAPAAPAPQAVEDGGGRVPARSEVVEQAALAARGPVAGEDIGAMRARESELRAILNSAADGIATLDGDGRIRTFNASAEAIFGREASEVVGDKLSSLLDQESARTVEAYLQSVGDRNVPSLHREGREVTGRRADGGTIPLFLTVGPMKVEDGPRFCAVIRDITQWKRSENELRRARDQAEQASSKKSDFLARISHELRTPLNAIIGFSEVMSEEKFGPIANDRYKGYLADIRASGEHLLSLINDLLDLSKIEAGKLELNFGSVDLSPLVQQCVQIMQPQANRERVIMRVSLPDALPPVVADERAMRQILLNLMSNAIKFTPPGGQVILSTVLDEDGSAQIRIRDTGAGMNAAELERAMEPFRQIDVATRETNVPGTGLGLPLTKALAEANRAEFRIESTPGAGTLVRIIFPPERVLDG